jgi:hypothetical protein
VKTKERPHDRALPGRAFFTRDDLAPRRRDGGVDEEARVDGVTARGHLSSRRSGRTRSVHHGLDVTALAGLIAVGEWLWLAAKVLEAEMPNDGRGRPRQHGVADILLYAQLTKVFRSVMAVERFLSNQHNWRLLSDAVATAWPDDPSRRLHSAPPSRYQYFYVRRKYISIETLDEIEEISKRLAIEQALRTGLFDPTVGSAFEPHKLQMAVSDGTWELAQTNASSTPRLDKVTGERVTRRHDPDAYHYHDGSKPVGNMLVFMGAPGRLPGTSVILNAAYTAGRKEQDSDVAARMAIEAKKSLPGLRGLAHDKSATGKHREELLANAIVLINGLPMGKGGKLLSHLLGELTFRIKANGGCEKMAVWTIDGHPCIEVHDGNEMVYLKLERLKNLPRHRRRSNRIILYAEWAVPDHPLAPRRLRKAHTMIRHNSTPAEIAESKMIARHLLLISPHDPLYAPLYGTREFAESINNAYKQCFVNHRARSIGLKNRRLDALGFITVFNYESLLMWKKHTGGDISRWFGHHDPYG